MIQYLHEGDDGRFSSCSDDVHVTEFLREFFIANRKAVNSVSPSTTTVFPPKKNSAT